MISLVLIVLGLTRPTESAQALIGFFFLFLLSFVLLNGSLEYEIGASVTTNLTYSGGELSSTSQAISYNYDTFNETLSHRLGLYLAIASAVGFGGVLFSLRRTKWVSE